MADRSQHSNKMAKKPKKDSSAPKPATDRPAPPVTTVIPRGKDKNK
jgi:hypothetical protein